MVVKGKTKSGIKFQLDSKIKDDTRLMFLLTKAQRSVEEPTEMTGAMMDLLALIFGSEDNVMLFMNEVAEKHKGVCDSGSMITELNEMFDAISAKNS